MHNPKLVDMKGEPLIPAQERCNQVWREIALARGLKWETIAQAPGMTAEFFTAEALPTIEKGTEHHASDQY